MLSISHLVLLSLLAWCCCAFASCICDAIDETRERRQQQQAFVLSMKFASADVAVVGSGPTGQTISYMLQAQLGLSVALIDPRVNADAIWYPNYGEWRSRCLADMLEQN